MINIHFSNYHLSVLVSHNCLCNNPDVLSKCKNTHLCSLLHCESTVLFLQDHALFQNDFSN